MLMRFTRASILRRRLSLPLSPPQRRPKLIHVSRYWTHFWNPDLFHFIARTSLPLAPQIMRLFFRTPLNVSSLKYNVG
jgi:hypothetical protein